MKKILAILMCLTMCVSFCACGGGTDSGKTDSGNEKSVQYEVKPDATDLTITDGDRTVTYIADELQNLGTVELTYSGRNKKVKDARVFETYKGVEIKKLLKESGFSTENANLKIICSDGYTREYSVDGDLYGKYAYKNNDSDKKEEVVPIIAVVDDVSDAEYPSPFKLVYGQADYDTYDNSSQDYNVQGWGMFVQYMELSYN